MIPAPVPALTLCLVLATAGIAAARDISGQMAYRERLALPPDAQILVTIRGAQGIVAELREPTGARQVPLPFRLHAPEATLELEAALLVGGERRWLSIPIEIPPGDAPVELGLIPLVPHLELPAPVTLSCGPTLLQVGVSEGLARLRLGEETRELAATEAASGARYSDGGLPETVYWSKGDSATITWSGVSFPECRPFPDPQREVITARGNEPGWVMTAGPEGLALSTEAGDAAAGALPPARLAAQAISWTIPGGPTLVLSPALCADTMTGMPYPLTASVRRDGRTLTGCAGDPATLLAGDWRITALADATLPQGAEGSLRFEDGRVSGRSFCNSFNASATLSGEGLRLGPAAATRMACATDQMAAEGTLLGALAKVDRFDITPEGHLHLLGGDRLLIEAQR